MLAGLWFVCGRLATALAAWATLLFLWPTTMDTAFVAMPHADIDLEAAVGTAPPGIDTSMITRGGVATNSTGGKCFLGVVRPVVTSVLAQLRL